MLVRILEKGRKKVQRAWRYMHRHEVEGRVGKGKKGLRAGEWLRLIASLVGEGFRGLVGGGEGIEVVDDGEGKMKEWLREEVMGEEMNDLTLSIPDYPGSIVVRAAC